MGRPSKYNKTMLKTALDLMGEGASKVEVCAELGISRETMNDWCTKESDRYNKEFSDTIKRGVALSNAWWEKHGRKNLSDKNFNATLWYMNMKNRFGWADKKEIKQEGDLTVVIKKMCDK